MRRYRYDLSPVRRLFATVLILALAAAPAAAETFRERLRPPPEFPYQLEARREAALIATGLGFTVTGFALDLFVERTTAEEYGLENLNKDDVFFLDRMTMQPYSELGQNAAHALFFVTLLSPLPTIVNQDFGTMFTIGMMYGQTLMLSYGVKETVLHAVPRFRPQSYYDDTPAELNRGQGSRKSFPSGHAAHTFAAATFATTVFSTMYPDSPYRYALAAGSYGMATTVAALRVSAGRHFLTDVLAGAAWGSFVGWFVPRLHLTDRTERAVDVAPLVTPDGFGLMLRLQ